MNDNIFSLIHKKDLKKIKELIEKDNSIVNSRDKMGRTPLMEAVIINNFAICKYLVEVGADINLQENGGWTALHFAAQEYSYEITKYLIENNAGVDFKDNFGNTPLFRALFNSKGKGDVIKILLSKGADKDSKNNSGVSPYDLAKQVTNYNLLQFFQ